MKDPKRYCTYLNVERYSFIAFPHCVLGIYINLMLVLKRHAKFLLKSTGTQKYVIDKKTIDQNNLIGFDN